MKKLIIKPKNIYSVIALASCVGLVMGVAALGPKEITQSATSSDTTGKKVIEAEANNEVDSEGIASVEEEPSEKETPDLGSSIDDFGGQITADDTNSTDEEWIYVEDDTWEESADSGNTSDWIEETYDNADASALGDKSSWKSSSVTIFTDGTSGSEVPTTDNVVSGVLSGVSIISEETTKNTNTTSTESAVIESRHESSTGGSSSYDASEGQNYETPILPAR